MSAQGVAVQALAGEIVAAVKADAGHLVAYDIAAGRFGPAFTALLNRLAVDALAVARNATRLQTLRELCGYLQDGSDTVVHVFQDDATRTWVVKVGEHQHHFGDSLGQALDAARVAVKL